ncbi:MAG: hypothetical protein ACXVKK_13620 [Flavisolibacter sp.]
MRGQFHAKRRGLFTRNIHLTPKDKEEIKDLLESIKISHDFKAEEIYKCLLAEAKYYVENDLSASIRMLEELKNSSQHKNYPQKALLEIYRRRGMKSAEQQIRSEMIPEDQQKTLLDLL